jgi:ribonuclease Z
MSNRELYALGTASQVPTRQRNHNGYFLEWDDEGFLFDPGEGTQRQMIFAGVAARDISRIFITHFHGDHCLGLAGVLQRLSLDRVDHQVQVYFPKSGRPYFENLRDAAIHHAAADISPHEIETGGVLFESASLKVSTLKLDHTVEAWGYRVEEPASMTLIPEQLEALGIAGPLVGALKRDGSIVHQGREISVEEVGVVRAGQSFAFVMDTRLCDAAYELADGVDVLVMESTFLSENETEAHAHGHLTAAQAAGIARESGAGLLVLAHFSQRYGDEADFVGEAKAIHAEVVALADGESVQFPKRRRNLRNGCSE